MRKLRIAFLATHNGSSAQAIVATIDKKALSAQAVLFISNNPDAPALQFARDHHPSIPTVFIKTHPSADKKLFEILTKHNIHLVVLSGYMKKIGPITIRNFRGKILNVHPSLPDSPFKGQGFYGDRIHQAVLDAKATRTGAMIHVVDERYDNGPVVAYKQVPVYEKDTLETLRKRVQNIEKLLFVEVVKNITTGKIELPLIGQE